MNISQSNMKEKYSQTLTNSMLEYASFTIVNVCFSVCYEDRTAFCFLPIKKLYKIMLRICKLIIHRNECIIDSK